MRLVLGFVVAVATGCGTYSGSVTTPRSDLTTYPHEVEYQLLGRANGMACSHPDAIDSFAQRTSDKWNGKYRYLYELAKYQALSEVKDADLLLFVRTNEFEKNGQICVELTARAAKVTSVKAVVGPSQTSEAKSVFGFAAH